MEEDGSGTLTTVTSENVTEELNSFYFYEITYYGSEALLKVTRAFKIHKEHKSESIQCTSKHEKRLFYDTRRTEQLAVLWILFVLIVLGNSAVLLALLMNKRQKSRMNFFIMHLAIADLSVGMISVLTDIVWHITVSWYAGNAACKIIRFLQVVVTYSSTYVLVALSIDRYDAITHPMNFSGSWRRARVLVFAAWMLSVLFSIPMIVLYQEKIVQGRTQCWIDFPEQWQWKVYVTLVALSLFVMPTLIISACYTVIVFTIWSKSKLLTYTASRTRRSTSTFSWQTRNRNTRTVHHHREEQDCRRASSRGLIPRAKIKTVKMTFVIVFVFIVCWSPYIVFDLLQVYGYVPSTQSNIALATFIQSLAPLNSAANPVIYCVFSTQISRNLNGAGFRVSGLHILPGQEQHAPVVLRKLPPFSWVSIPAKRWSRRFGTESSSTVTETLHSFRHRSASSSIRHSHKFHTNRKVAMSVV